MGQQEEFREWLSATKDRLGKTADDISRTLGKNRTLGSKLLKGVQKITRDHIAVLSEKWDVEPPRGFHNRPGLRDTIDAASGAVPVVGRIAEHVWVSERDTTSNLQRRAGSLRQGFPIKDQIAFEVDAPGRPGEIYEVGDFVIAVPFGKYRREPRPHDLIVTRKRDTTNRVNYDLFRAVEANGEIQLKPVLEGIYPDDESVGEFFAIVITFQRDVAA